MPVASAYGKKIRALSSGKEIAEKQHEDLFLWLTEKLEDVVRDRWRADSDKLEEKAVEAMNNWRSGAKSKLEQLSSLVRKYCRKNRDISTQASRCKKAGTAVVARVQPWQKSEEFGYASLRDWAGQHPVREVSTDNWVEPGYRRADEAPSKIVGFVDLAAIVDVVVGLSLKPSMGSEPGMAYESQVSEYHFTMGPDRELLQRLKAWEPKIPKWEAKRHHLEVWFDIRAQPFVVGEMLRELRTLREYLPSSPTRSCCIALVVEDCTEQVESLLNHEDFWVVSRRAWDARGLDEVELPANDEAASDLVLASLTAGEKRALEEVKKEATKKHHGATGKSQTRLTAEELLENAERVFGSAVPSRANKA